MTRLQAKDGESGGSVAPKPGSDPTEEALDAIFGSRPSFGVSDETAPARDVPFHDSPADAEVAEPDRSFAQILRGLQAQIGAPANDDRAGERERSASPGPPIEARIGPLLAALAATALLCAASGILSQLDLGRVSRDARLAIWPFGAASALLVTAFLLVGARWQARMHRRHEGEIRRHAEHASRREKDLAGQTELLRLRTADMAAELAHLRMGIADLIAVTDGVPDVSATLADNVAQGERLAARLSAQERLIADVLVGLRADIAASHALATRTAESVAEAMQRYEPPPAVAVALTEPHGALADREAMCDVLRAFVEGEDGGTTGAAAAEALLDLVFDTNGLLLAWECYRARGTAAFADAYRRDHAEFLPIVRHRLQGDRGFRAAAQRFFERFERVLTASAQDRSDAGLMRRLCSTDGRCYTLLAHATGRIAST